MNLIRRAGVLATAGMATSAVLAASACGGPSTTPGSGPIPGTGGLAAKVVPPPAGFALSQGVDVRNGPMSAAAFNRWIGTRNLAARLHFIRGYHVTYDSTTNSDRIEVIVFQFATATGATAFKGGFSLGGPISSRADAVIPGADDYDSRSPRQGAYVHGVIATKGNLVFLLNDATGSAAKVPLVEKLARQQYAALHPYQPAASPSPVRLAAVEAPAWKAATVPGRTSAYAGHVGTLVL